MNQKPVALWLFICAAMVFMMVVVGGVTRLTHSGLSIVEWQPIVGAVPPLSEADWQQLFLKYQQTPEYQKINRGMSLTEFQGIFWWEYFHRLLGRAIGLVFALPLIYFWLKKQIAAPFALKLLGIFLLGGLQGLMGWYMVKSGLVDDPRVSPYRLGAHLGLAFVIYALLLRAALRAIDPRPALSRPPTGLQRYACALTALIFLMVLSGSQVAGIRAGLAYNTFPLMDGNFIPPEILMLEPWHLNFSHNMATVQFHHRMVAWLLMIAIPIFWWQARHHALPPRAKQAVNTLLALLVMQVSLGIATLLMVVPVSLAVAHQAGAVLLFGAAIWVNHELR